MITISLRFPAGRLHGTPWGRHVNEGEPEWPPSPFRLARALVDVARKRLPELPDARLQAALALLSAPIRFSLPPASTGHTRSYLHSNKTDPTSRQKILDAFVAVDRETPLFLAIEADPEPQAAEDLAMLLENLDYLGRSESWVKAALVDGDYNPGFNCLPAESPPNPRLHELVWVACLASEREYLELEKKPMEKRKIGKRTVEEAIPWLAALCLSTDDLAREGWSQPPAMVWRPYLRPARALRPSKGRRMMGVHGPRQAHYELSSKVLPGISETLSIAERIRVKLMGLHRRIQGGQDSLVSPLFSGKGPSGEPDKDHEHVFIWPTDEDMDGRIDHLLIQSKVPFDPSELRALDLLRSTWQSGGRPDLDIVLLSLDEQPERVESRTWITETPFVIHRHHKKNRGAYQDWLEAEIRRECANHGIPDPQSVEWIQGIEVQGLRVPFWSFIRSRKGQVPTPGHGCVLHFAEPVAGPFALGALCHFGLGLFRPV